MGAVWVWVGAVSGLCRVDEWRMEPTCAWCIMAKARAAMLAAKARAADELGFRAGGRSLGLGEAKAHSAARRMPCRPGSDAAKKKGQRTRKQGGGGGWRRGDLQWVDFSGFW